MKKLFICCLLSGGILMMATGAHAQIGTLPAAVTDSFKFKYPDAKQVSWTDKLGYWQVSFYQGADELTAKFKTDGTWQSSMKKIAQTSLPPEIQDGFSKSLYADGEWRVSTVEVIYLPGNVTQYGIRIEKSQFTKKNLLFNSKGRLIKENAAL